MAKRNNLTRRRMILVIFAFMAIIGILLLYTFIGSKNTPKHTFQEPENGPPKQYTPGEGPINK